MSVNRKTDPKQKDADVARKLRLYGIYQAFSLGKCPSNKQIDIALNSAIGSKALSKPSDKLSEEGRHLVDDLKDVIDQAKMLLLTKNHDQVLQEFIWHTQQAVHLQAPTPNAPVTKDQASEDGQKALSGLRTLGTLLITNGQFRKLLNDASILFRDVASDAASNAAGKIRPPEDKLNQIDQPAQDHTWHSAPTKEGLKQQMKDSVNKNKPFSRQDAEQAANTAAQTADPQGQRDPTAVADKLAYEQQTGQPQNVDAFAGAQAGINQLKEKVPEDQKERARRLRERTNNYAKNKLPQERRDQIIFRLKKMVVEIQGHQDYQQAIDTLLYLAENYAGHGKNIVNQTTGTVKSAHDDNHLKSAERCIKTLLERFANNTSSEDLFESINDIYRDSEKDEALKNWFRSVDHYIRKCLQEQGYILTDGANDEYDRLYDEGRYLLRERYRDHTDRVIEEFKFLGDQFANDPQSVKFGNTVQKLFVDLGNDPQGHAAFKKHLVKDLTSVILPGAFESVQYVPIPRIEYTDPQMDVVVENLVVESDNLMPNVLEIGNDSFFRWGRKDVKSKNKQKFMISVSGIQCDLKAVSYYVRKKQGFPSIKDTGVMDVFMGGQGFSFKLEVSSAEGGDRQHFFKIDTVKVDVKHVNIKLHKSNHKTLFAIFKPLLLRVLRPALQKVLEKQIKDTFHELDSKLYAIQKEVEKAEADFKRDPTPENAKSIYNRYWSAAQKEFTVKKEKAKEITADKKANVAITKEDSIFKDISLPGGISTKATEFKEMARKGDRWESPVFDLGSAKESSSIPNPVAPSRKPHNIKRASVNTHRDSGFGAGGGGDAGLGQGGAFGTAPAASQGGAFGTAPATGPGFGGASGFGAQPRPGAPYDPGNNDTQFTRDNVPAEVRGALSQMQ